jgi:hypothetical protein
MSSCLDEFIFHTSGKVAIPAIPAIPERVSSHNSHPFKSVQDESDALLPEQISSTENLPDLDDTHDHIQEHLDERSAIMEYDGGLTREQAEAEAQRALRVFHYRLTDNPGAWLVLIAPGCDLGQATKICHNTFGSERVMEVRVYKHFDRRVC